LWWAFFVHKNKIKFIYKIYRQAYIFVLYLIHKLRTQLQQSNGSKGENNMFKKMGLLKLGGCVLALGLLNAVINPEDKDVEVKKEVQVVEEIKNEVDYNTLEIEDIEEVILSVVKEKTNKKKDRIVSIEVSNENYLFVDLNANSYDSTNNLLTYSSKIYNELKKFKSAEQINIVWHAIGINDTGNEVELEVVKTGFSKEALNKINFEKFPTKSYKKYSLPYFVQPGW